MANRNETTTSTVLLDGKQAEDQLKKMKEKARDLRQEMIKLQEANNLVGFQKAEKELKLINSEIKQLSKETFQLEKVLKNLNGTSLSDLLKAQKQVSHEMKKMERGTEEYIAKSKQYQQVSAEIKKVRTEMNGVVSEQKNWLSGAADKFNQYFGLITAGVAAFAGVGFSIRKAVDAYNEYEDKVANLSALTGLQGQDLQDLSQKAKELSISTTETGVNITKSSGDIVDAFTKMGSAKPELLKDKEALAAVTEQALILAEAAKMDTTVAVEGLANTMNQFGADADEAARYINVLAAGSKEGAAEIPQISDSIIKFGAAAAQANVSVEESVAMIEALSEKGIKGEIAGNGLKNVLLELMSGADDTNPKVVGLNKALDNLANKNLSASEMVKIFGKENYIAAQVVVSNRDRIEELTKAVTGTSVAYQQANTNTETNTALLAQAQNKAALNTIELGQRLAPTVTYLTMSYAKFIPYITKFIDFMSNNIGVLKFATVTIGTYISATILAARWQSIKTEGTKENILWTKAKIFWDKAGAAATQLGSAATMLFTGNIKGASQAMKNFTSIIKINPFVLIATTIAAVGTALYLYSQKVSDVIKQKQALMDVEGEAQKKMIEEKWSVEQLLKVAKNQQESLTNRKKAVEELNKISPEYLGNIKLEEINTTDTTTAIEKYLVSLEKKYKMEVLHNKILEESRKQVDIQHSKAEENISFWETAWNYATGTDAVNIALKNIKTVAVNKKKAMDESIAMQKTYEKELANLKKESDANLITPNSSGLTEDQIAAAKAKEEAAKKEKLKSTYEKLNEQIKYYNELLTEQIATHNAQAPVTAKLLTEAIARKKAIDDEIEAMKIRAEMEDELKKPIEKIKTKPVDEIKLDNKTDYGKEMSEFLDREQKRQQILEENRKLEIQKEKEKYEAIAAMAIDATNKIVDASFQISANKRDAEYNTQMNELQKQRDRELDNKKLTESQKEAINKKYAAKEKAIKEKQWKAQQSAAALQALINGALTITNIMATTPPPTWPFTIPSAAVAIAAQEAVILSQPMPQYAKGKYPVVGADDGKTYQANIVSNARTGMINSPAILVGEKPEMIIDNPTYNRLALNFPEALAAIEKSRGVMPQYAKGSYRGVSSKEAIKTFFHPIKTEIANQKENLEIFQSIDRHLVEIVDKLDNLGEISTKLDKPTRAKVLYSDYEKVKANLDNIKNDYGG